MTTTCPRVRSCVGREKSEGNEGNAPLRGVADGGSEAVSGLGEHSLFLPRPTYSRAVRKAFGARHLLFVQKSGPKKRVIRAGGGVKRGFRLSSSAPCGKKQSPCIRYVSFLF